MSSIRKTRRKSNPVIMGRRVCSGPCGRWRHLIDFGHKADCKASLGRYVLGICEPCQKVYGKEWYKKNADRQKSRVKQWKEANPELVDGYRQAEKIARRTPEGRVKERARQRKRYYDPVRGPRVREYQRIYRNMKRSEADGGRDIDLRYAKSKESYRESKVGKEEVVVPREPFVVWLEDLKSTGKSFNELAKQAGVDSSRYRTIMRGSFVKNGVTYSQTNVSLSFIDSTLIASGTDTQIWDLYPEEQHPEIYATD